MCTWASVLGRQEFSFNFVLRLMLVHMKVYWVYMLVVCYTPIFILGSDSNSVCLGPFSDVRNDTLALHRWLTSRAPLPSYAVMLEMITLSLMLEMIQ
jgi:hypothetical protein